MRDVVEARLAELLPAAQRDGRRLQRAMRYALLDGGKRLRPLIAVATTEALGGDARLALDPGCAIEMVHTASLILDDLPCMDDAGQRRGKPATHRAYGEDIALLGAVTLITEAFGVIARAPGLDASVRTRLAAALSGAVGADGLSGGQELDLHAVDASADAAGLADVQQRKTGALFVACMETGARVAGLDGASLEPLCAFGRHLGAAFQIFDDLLDSVGTAASTGKDHRQDSGRASFVSVLGVAEAERRAFAALEDGLAAVRPVANPAPFAALVDLVERAYLAQAELIVVPDRNARP